MSRLVTALLALALLLTACGSTETRQITYALAGAQERLGGTPVKLLATAHPSKQELLLFYQYRKDPEARCGSGAALVRPGQSDQALDEEHACAESDTAISTVSKSGALGDYALSYGLVFDPRVSRVAVDFGSGDSANATVSGGAWWVLRRIPSAPVRVIAYDRSGKALQTVNLPPA